MTKLVRTAAALFPDADIEIVEAHHNHKIDVPSGTALMLAEAVKKARPQATFNIGRHENGKRTKEEVGIHSLRMGNTVGIHEVTSTPAPRSSPCATRRRTARSSPRARCAPRPS